MYIKKEISNYIIAPDINTDLRTYPLDIVDPKNPTGPTKNGGHFVIYNDNGKNYVEIHFSDNATQLFFRKGTEPDESTVKGYVDFKGALSKDAIGEPGEKDFDIDGSDEDEVGKFIVRPKGDAFIRKSGTVYNTNTDNNTKTDYNNNRIRWEILANPTMENLIYPYTVKENPNDTSAKFTNILNTITIERVKMNLDGGVASVASTFTCDFDEMECSDGTYTVKIREGETSPGVKNGELYFDFDHKDNSSSNEVANTDTFRIVFHSDAKKEVFNNTSSDSQRTYTNKTSLDYKVKEKNGDVTTGTATDDAKVNITYLRDAYKTVTSNSNSENTNKRYTTYTAYINRFEDLVDTMNYEDNFELRDANGNVINDKIDFEMNIKSVNVGYFKNDSGAKFQSLGASDHKNYGTYATVHYNGDAVHNDIPLNGGRIDFNITNEELKKIFTVNGQELFDANGKTNKVLQVEYEVVINSEYAKDLTLVNKIKRDNGYEYKRDTDKNTSGFIVKEPYGSNYSGNTSARDYSNKTIGWRASINKFGYELGKYPTIKDELKDYLSYVDNSGNVIAENLKVGNETLETVFLCNTANIKSTSTTIDQKAQDCIDSNPYFQLGSRTDLNMIFGGYKLIYENNVITIDFDFGATTDAENNDDIANGRQPNKIDELSEALNVYKVSTKKDQTLNKYVLSSTPTAIKDGSDNAIVVNKELRKSALKFFFRTNYDPSKMTEYDADGLTIARNKIELDYYNNGNNEHIKDETSTKLKKEVKNNGKKEATYTKYEEDLEADKPRGFFTWQVYFDYNQFGVNNGTINESTQQYAKLVDKVDGLQKFDIDEIYFGNYGVKKDGTIDMLVSGPIMNLKGLFDIVNNHENETHKIANFEDLYTIYYLGKDANGHDVKYTDYVEALKVSPTIQKTVIELNIGLIIQSDWYKNQRNTTQKFTFDKMLMFFKSEVADAVYRQAKYQNEATLTTYNKDANGDFEEYTRTVDAYAEVGDGEKLVHKDGSQNQEDGAIDWNIWINKNESVISKISLVDTLSPGQVYINDSVKVYATREVDGKKVIDYSSILAVNEELEVVHKIVNGQSVIEIKFPESYKLDKETIVVTFRASYIPPQQNLETDEVRNHVSMDYVGKGYELTEDEKPVIIKKFEGKGVIHASDRTAYPLAIYKYDSEDNKVPLAGARFKISSGSSIYYLESDEDGYVFTDQIPLFKGQKIEIQEVTPPKGYLINEDFAPMHIVVGEDEKFEITAIKDNEGNNVGQGLLVEVPNTLKPELKVDKKLLNHSIDESNVNDFIKGLEFDLYVYKATPLGISAEFCGEHEWRKVTNKESYVVGNDGKINLGHLEASKLRDFKYYKLVERKNDKTIIDTKPYYFEVVQDNFGNDNIKMLKVTDGILNEGCDLPKVVIDPTYRGKKVALNNYLGKITITKIETNKPDVKLGGVKFSLYKKNIRNGKDHLQDYTIAKDEESVTIENLSPGTYYLKEIEAPENYRITEDELEFVIPETLDSTKEDFEKTISLTDNFENDPMAPLKIDKKLLNIKHIENNNNENNYKKFDGEATFNIGVVENNQCIIKDATDVKSVDNNGQIDLGNLSAGWYCLKELSATESVANGTEFRFEVASEAGKDNYIKPVNGFAKPFVNYLGRVELTKWGTNKENVRTVLKDVEFNLYLQKDPTVQNPDVDTKITRVDAESGTTDIFITNPEGKIIVEDLLPGSYYFKEVKSVGEFKITEDFVDFIIADEYDGSNLANVDVTLTAENLTYHPVILFKKAKNNAGTEVNPGAQYQFKVYPRNGEVCDFKNPIKDGTNQDKIFTNGAVDGSIVLAGVTEGKYCMQEVDVLPEGGDFAINTNPIKFEIKKNTTAGNYDYIVEGQKEIVNENGSFKLTKKNNANNPITSEARKTAKFNVLKLLGREYQPFESGLTINESGIVEVKDLGPGMYRIYEVEAPKYFILEKDKYVEFEIPKTFTNSDVLHVADEMTNEEMPKLKLNKKLLGIENRESTRKAVDFEGIAKFNITTVVDGKCTTNKVGDAETKTGEENHGLIFINQHLDAGYYCMQETESSTGMVNKTEFRFKVIKDTEDRNILKVETDNKGNLPTFYNYTGRVELTKYAGKDKEATLDGAKFRLYKAADDGRPTEIKNTEAGNDDGQYESKNGGKIVVTDLLPGRYYFEETVAPKGFRLSADRISFEISSEVDINNDKSIAFVDVTAEAINYPNNKVKLKKKGILHDKVGREVTKKLGEGYKFNISIQKNNKCSNEYVMKDDEKLVVKTNANGEIEMVLDPGKYCLEEIEVNEEEGYLLNIEKFEFEVVAEEIKGAKEGPKHELKIKASQNGIFYNFKGSVKLTKTLDGKESDKKAKYFTEARFTLYKQLQGQPAPATDEIIKENIMLDERTGEYVHRDLAPGKYYFVETAAPDHYVLDQTPIVFDIAKKASSIKNATSKATHDNTRMNELEIKKVGYIDDNNSEALEGAKFNLFKCNDEECKDSIKLNEQDLVSENGGVIKLGNLLVGKYFLQETDANTANTGYHINETKLFFNVVNDKESGQNVIEKQDGKEVIFENYKPKVQVFKFEIIGHDEKGEPITMPLQGAEFGLFKYDGPRDEEKDANTGVIDWTKVQNRLIAEKHFENNEPVQTLKDADANGNYTSDYVEQGWYYIFETKAPDYYSQVMIPQLFPNKIEGQAINSKELIIDPEYRVIGMMNERFADAAHQIKKLDEDNKPVANAEFDLYNKDGNKKVNGTFKSNENGIIALGSLAPGHYYLKETKAGNTKYMLNTDQLDFEVVKDGTNGDFINGGENVKFINYQGKQKINKVDNNNRPLKGAKFDLFTKAGKKVKSIDMSSKSTLTIDKLAPGEYYLVETKAPKGFAKSEKHHNFTIPEKHAGAMDNDYINSKALTITNDTEEDTENKKKTQDEEKEKDGMGTTNYGTPTSGSMLLGLAGILGMIGIGSYAVRKRFND